MANGGDCSLHTGWLQRSLSEDAASPSRRKLLLANSAVTPCNKLEWSLSAGRVDGDDGGSQEETLPQTGRPSEVGGAARLWGSPWRSLHLQMGFGALLTYGFYVSNDMAA